MNGNYVKYLPQISQNPFGIQSCCLSYAQKKINGQQLFGAGEATHIICLVWFSNYVMENGMVCDNRNSKENCILSDKTENYLCK